MKTAVIKQASIFGLIAFLSACGGGSGGNGDGGNGPLLPAPPVAKIQFPPPQSLTNQTSITVRGTAQDTDGSDITSIQVNGVAVESSDGFATWQVTLPLQLGENTLVVATADADGNTNPSAASVVVQAKAFPNLRGSSVDGLVVDTANNRALVVDSSFDALFAIDLASGERTVLSSNSGIDNFLNQSVVGSGTNFRIPDSIQLDSESQRVLLNEKFSSSTTIRGTMAVDLNTGERIKFLDQSAPGGSGPAFKLIRSSQLDHTNNRLLIMDGFNGDLRLFTMDLASRNRSILSSKAVGAGPNFNTPLAITLDVANNLLYAADRINNQGVVFAIDLDNGNRTIVSGINSGTLVGNGPEMISPVSIKFDSSNNRALIADRGVGALFIVDLNNGDRTRIDGEGPSFVSLLGADFFGEQQAVALDQLLETLVMVDLITGDRQLLPNNAIGTGPRIESPHSFALTSDGLLISESAKSRLLNVNPDNGNRNVVVDAPEQFNFQGLTVDQRRNRAFVFNHIGSSAELMVMDLSTKELRVLSSTTVGSGPDFITAEKITYHSGLNRILVADSGARALIAVNPDTGERSILSDNDSTGVDFDLPTGLAVNRDGSRALVVDSNLGVLFDIDLATGARTILSGQNPETGEIIGDAFDLFEATALVLDEQNNRALITITDGESGPVVAVNLTTGEQTELPDSAITGIDFFSPEDLILDADNNRLLILESSKQAILVLDLKTQERVVVSWTDINRFF